MCKSHNWVDNTKETTAAKLFHFFYHFNWHKEQWIQGAILWKIRENWKRSQVKFNK